MTPLHVALIDAYNAHRNTSWIGFQKIGLTKGQPKVLSRLLSCEGAFQKELAEYCSVSPATMTVILHNMEKRGLVRKEKALVSGGKRAFRIFLTELGIEKAIAVDQVVWDVEAVAYSNFTEEEKDQLTHLLGKVTDNLINSTNN